jgi:hypothetical protein
MTAIDDRPTIGERYSSATESSNLKVSTERRGDVDVIIAAGWCSETLGASLARLRTEFDSVRAGLRGVGGGSATDKVLALLELKTLRSTKEALGDLALTQATRVRFARADAEVLKVAGRVLDAFLDPNCPRCDGRGFSGGGRHEQSGPQVLCRPCGGTGKRRGQMGRDDEERRFAGGLLSDIEQKAALFEQQMGRRLSERDSA